MKWLYPSCVLRNGQKKSIGYIATKCIYAVNMYVCLCAVVQAHIKSDQIIKLLLTRFIFIDYDLTYIQKNHTKRVVNWLCYLLVLLASCLNEMKFIINHEKKAATLNMGVCVCACVVCVYMCINVFYNTNTAFWDDRAEQRFLLICQWFKHIHACKFYFCIAFHFISFEYFYFFEEKKLVIASKIKF